VWERLDRESKLERVGMSLIAGGAALSGSALWRPRRHPWAFAVGFACVAAGLFCQRGAWRLPAWAGPRNPSDEAIDRASADSFPASDPPSIPAAEPNL
jgi:hypothetical protein